MFAKQFSRALAVAMAMTLAITSVAFADQLRTDADALVAGSQNGNIDLNLNPGQTATINPAVWVREQGHAVSWPVEISIAKSGDAWLGSLSRTSGNLSAYGVENALSTSLTVTAPNTGLRCNENNGFTGTVTFSASDPADQSKLSADFVSQTINLTVPGGQCPPDPDPDPVDETAPTGTITINDNAAWTNSTSVRVDLTGADAEGVTGYRLAQTQAGLATATTVAVSPAESDFSRTDLAFTLSSGDGTKAAWVRLFDAAGNEADFSDTIGLDTVAPTITPSTNGYTLGTWTANNVTVSFSCADNAGGSGLATNTVAGGTLSTTGADQEMTNTGSCVDNAGNVAASVTVSDIDIDKQKPTLGVIDNNVAAYNVCDTGMPTQPTHDIQDAHSGVNLASINEVWNAPASGLGTFSYSLSASDNVGNSESYSRTYTRTYGDAANGGAFSGILQPVNSDGTSRFKLGSTVPIKFRLMCGTTPVTSASATLYVGQKDSRPDPGIDEAISTAASTTGNLFRYSADGQQYIFNLNTKAGYTNSNGTTTSFSQGTYSFTIFLGDGTHRTFQFQLVK